MEKFTNTITNAISDRDSKNRTMTFVISDESVNRYKHKVMVDGWNLQEYKKNPILLVDHVNSAEYTVAKAKRVWIDRKKRQLKGTFDFLPEGTSARADLMWALYDNDFLSSVSAGYQVDRSKAVYGKNEKEPDITFNGQELLEVSLVAIPANTNARKEIFTNAIELGIIDEDLIQRVEQEDAVVIEDTEPEVQEDEVKEDIVDYTDPDVQEECIQESEDDLYGELFDCLVEDINNNDVGYVASKALEELESDDSIQDSDQDFDAWLDEFLNKL